MLLIPIALFGQGKYSDSITFGYNKAAYEKIALDTIKSMYDTQIKLLHEGNVLSDEAVVKRIPWKDLEIVIIPKFRLKRNAAQLFTCTSNIENFIEFKEKNRYMSVIIEAENKFQTMITVPHPYFEIERTNNPDWRLAVTKTVYEDIVRTFLVIPEYYAKIQKMLVEKKNNYFFGIYGLWDVILEIDTTTGELYANKIDYGNILRLPANEYIRKYEGSAKIKAIANGYYEDIDDLGVLDPSPCTDIEINQKKIYLKVVELH